MAETSNPIYEDTRDGVISFRNGKSTSIMRFLKPYGQTPSIKTPLISATFSRDNPSQWPIKVSFSGCRKPPSDWCDWVEKLSIKYAKIWEQTGICDAILSSLYEIKPNPEIVLCLCEFWCPETNTFIFPWGEATVTLEDVIILGGLPVLGEPVNLPLLSDSMKILEGKLNWARSDLSKGTRNAKRASYSTWIEYFSEGYNGEDRDSLEHVGFLAYWLSRFVFPDLNKRTVGKHVFPLAVCLSLGVNVALGPAVLACLYQNLSFLAQNAADCLSVKKEVFLPGPFWILELWAMERFPFIGLNLAKLLSLGHPRGARWDKLSLKQSLVDVREGLRSGDGFQWRPYALDLKNWRHRSYYPENELLVSDCNTLDDDDEELKSFRVCLHPQELVGIDCAETYRPQRVAMQFGYDQDFPAELANFSPLQSEKKVMFVPGRFYLPRVSPRYGKWWKESMGGNHMDSKHENDDHDKKPTSSQEHLKLSLSCEAECVSTGFKTGDSENDPQNSGLMSEVESLSNRQVQEESDDKNQVQSNDLMNSDSVAAETGTPRSEILDVSGDGRGRKRKNCAEKDGLSSRSVVFVDLDEQEVEKLGYRDHDQPGSTTSSVMKTGVGGCAENPLYVSDQCRKMGRKARKTGISLQNPIDVENYYL